MIIKLYFNIEQHGSYKPSNFFEKWDLSCKTNLKK